MLQTVDEIIKALGGSGAAAAATGVEPSAVSMWKARGKIPPNRFLAISKLLLKGGYQADPAVFGFAEAADIEGSK